MPLLDPSWKTLIKERFPPLSTLPMIVLFVAGNGLIAQHLTGISSGARLYFSAFLLALSFFFRLRLFDELKDYETDLKVNPHRPLARGLLSTSQVWNMALYLIGFEVVLAGFIGLHALTAHGLAIIYSLLMYKEFFVGRWLRPHLTLYAVTHTLVSAFLGFSMASIIISKPIWQFPPVLFLTALMNWSIFNLFEFARKTFSPGEERQHVDSYSSLYGVWGAVALSWSQAFIGAVCAVILVPASWMGMMAGAAVLLASGMYLGLVKSQRAAVFFRLISGGFILYFFAVLVVCAR